MNNSELAYFREYRQRPAWKRYHLAYMRQWRDDKRALALVAKAAGATGSLWKN